MKCSGAAAELQPLPGSAAGRRAGPEPGIASSRSRAAPLCQQLGLSPATLHGQTFPFSRKKGSFEGLFQPAENRCLWAYPDAFTVPCREKGKGNPLEPSYQHSGEQKGTWQKLPGVLYTSHLSRFTPLGKSTSPGDSSHVYKAFCLFVWSFPFSFSNTWPWWLVGRSPGAPGHPQRGDGVFLAHALTLGSPMGTVHGPRHNRSQLQSHLPVLSRVSSWSSLWWPLASKGFFHLKQDRYVLVLSWASRPGNKTRGFTDMAYLATSEPKFAQVL